MVVRPPGKQGKVTLIHPMCYKPQILTDEVLKSAFDKYVITYKNIWEKNVLRPYLLELGYFKTLGLLKGVPI